MKDIILPVSDYTRIKISKKFALIQDEDGKHYEWIFIPLCQIKFLFWWITTNEIEQSDYTYMGKREAIIVSREFIKKLKQTL